MKNQKDKHFHIAFVQILVPSYKLPMFHGISNLPGIKLTLFTGDRGPTSLPKGKPVWGIKHVPLQNTLFKIASFCIIWQRKLNKLLNPAQYDLVILPEGVLYISNYALIIRCLLKHTPFGFYSHGYNHQRRKTWLSRPLEILRKAVHRLASVIVVYSDEGAKHLIKNKHVSPQKVFIALNTLNTSDITNRISQIKQNEILKYRQSLGLPNDGILLAYTGRIEPIKNPDWILYVVQRLLSEGFHVHAIFIGSGSLLPTLQKKVTQSPSLLANAVTFVGNLPIDEVDRYLACSDICVLPGVTGLAVVHAFAAGKPYVTIESPHHGPEIAYMQHNINGIIAGPSQKEFFQAIKTLVLAPNMRQKLGQAALHDAQNKLSMNQQIKGFQNAFEYIASQSIHKHR